MKKTLVAVALTALAAVAFGANPPAIQWQRTFHVHKASSGWWVDLTSDGGFVVAGATWGTDDDGVVLYALYMVKTDSQGNREWEQAFPSLIPAEARRVQQTADGGYVLSCRTVGTEYGPDLVQPFLVKTDPSGEPEWSRLYYADTFEYGFCVRQTPDHGYILTATNPGVDSGLWLIKTDSLGDVKWQRTYGIKYGMPRNDLRVPVELAPDGGYIIGARTLLKVDSLGNVEWHQTTPRVPMMRSVLVASDGGYVGTGSRFYGNPPRQDSVSIYLHKTDQSGNLLWGRDIGGRASRGGYSVIQTPDGGYVVAGVVQPRPRYQFGKPTFNLYGVIIRTDSLGNPVWNKALPVLSGATCVRQTPDGGFIVAGMEMGGEAMRMSLWKLGPEGQ